MSYEHVYPAGCISDSFLIPFLNFVVNQHGSCDGVCSLEILTAITYLHSLNLKIRVTAVLLEAERLRHIGFRKVTLEKESREK